MSYEHSVCLNTVDWQVDIAHIALHCCTVYIARYFYHPHPDSSFCLSLLCPSLLQSKRRKKKELSIDSSDGESTFVLLTIVEDALFRMVFLSFFSFSLDSCSADVQWSMHFCSYPHASLSDEDYSSVLMFHQSTLSLSLSLSSLLPIIASRATQYHKWCCVRAWVWVWVSVLCFSLSFSLL